MSTNRKEKDDPKQVSVSPAAAPIEARFAAVLEDAAQRFSEASSSAQSLDDFTNPPMKNVADLQRILDRQNDRFANFRAKRQNIFHAVDATLAPIQVIGEMVAGAASEVFEPAQGIYSAVAYLINAAHDVSAIYDSILELFEQLKDFTSRLNVYVKHEMSAALREKSVTILASLFEVLVLATKEARRGRVKAYFKRLFGSDSPVPPALERLKALTLSEERQVIADTYGSVSQISVKTDRVEDVLNQVHQEVSILRSEARERINATHQDKLKEILDPSPFPDDFFSYFNKSRVEGTGNWILEDEGLQSWIDTETQYLWMCGAAGTGKSYLTTRLIDWSASNLSHFAYFFFRDNNPETRSVLQALRDVAYQLSNIDAFYAKQLLKRLSSADDIRTLASAFRRLLVEPFQDDIREKTLYIFLDGIDEADPKDVQKLLEFLAAEDESPERPPHIKIQFALTGRSHWTDTVTFTLDPQGSICTTLYVTPDRNAADVSQFIAEGVRHSRILARTSPDFRFEIIQAMEKQVDGLFILAKFMLAEVNRRRHPKSILASLQSYPTEINGMLIRSLKNLAGTISEDEAGDLNEMLRWVACAEESLSLEQLEAVLVLRFGDSPFRLEETLRGQYSSFFDLEREDGLTTDDLIKEYERKQRIRNDSPGRRYSSPGDQRPKLQRDFSPMGHGAISPAQSDDQAVLLDRSLSPGRHSNPRSHVSPARSETQLNPTRQLSPRPRGTSSGGSPKLGGGSPKFGSSPKLATIRAFSPAASPDFFDPVTEMEFRSNKANTWVTFFHTSVKEFFSKENSTSVSSGLEGPLIGFEPTSARVHIVKTCLSIFTDKAWFEKHELGDGRQAIKQYAAWYWQEHLAAIDPAAVTPDEKREIGSRVYKMLTDESVILDWSIMYEKNNEGLEVLTDANIVALKKWMSDPDVLTYLDPKARGWVAEAVSQSPGIFKPIGQFYAKAWVSAAFERYIPTLFCFKIVQAIAFMEEGYSWSETCTHWSDVPAEKRIAVAAKWAGYEETAHWHRRVGSTYLTLGKHGKALWHYDEALKLDHNSVETLGRIAYCLSRDGRFREALDRALECEKIEEKSIASGKLEGSELAGTQWRLYKDHILAATCYSELNKIEDALIYYQKAIKSAGPAVGLGRSEYYEPEIGYLELLATENRHTDMISFLREMSTQNSDARRSNNRLVDFLLDQNNKPLVMDEIPRSASKAKEESFLFESFELAIEAAHALRDPLKVLYLRLSLGATLMYSRNADAAIGLFEEISFDEYRPRGNVPTRQGYAISFQKLAGLFKEKILHAGLQSTEAKDWIENLERVEEKQSSHQNQDMPLNMVGSDINAAAIYLALFYRLLGRTEEARATLKALIMDSLDILSDDDMQNDEYALDNLLCLLIAANDIDNARALSQSMRKLNPLAAPTPSDSPIIQRIEPKLPEIQSTNRYCAQCLDYLNQSQDYVVCEYCMESFCMTCLETIIKKEGNKTSDHNPEVVCRSDHAWFTVSPLNKILHRGEILLGDGRVSSFSEWKMAIQNAWK